MGIACRQPLGLLATVNCQHCCTETELQRRLRQAITKKLTPVEIAIHDPIAQRVFLSFAVYSPQELLSPAVRDVVASLSQNLSKCTKSVGNPTHNLELSLAITEAINSSQGSAELLVGSALLFAIHQGYGTISFRTASQNKSTDIVWIEIKA